MKRIKSSKSCTTINLKKGVYDFTNDYNHIRKNMDIKKSEVIKFKAYQLFEVNEKKYIFTQDNAIYEIDDRTQKIIEATGSTYEEMYNRVNEDFTEQEFNELICAMKTSKFVIGEGEDSDQTITD